MDRSQSLNAPPFFDGSNYVFWKVRMCAFHCAIDETVWDSIENGYVRPTTAKFEWDKAALALANANSKAINAIFCGVSTDEFHRISHVKTTKKAFSLTNSYGMHLVILAHLSLFWMASHPSRTFLLKELEQESQNRLPYSPHHQTIPSLTSNPWPTIPVLAGYK